MTDPRFLFIDIETSPILGYSWGTHDTNIIRVELDWHILCFAWKWHDQKKVTVEALPDFDKYYKKNPHCDLKLSERLLELLDEADIICAHNGNGFDIPKIKSRLFIHGLEPPSPFKSVDTLQVARRQFRLTSNRLGEIGKVLNLGGKEDSGGFETWLGCMNGDTKAWNHMKKYNRYDVLLLEKVYDALKPWHSSHPSLAVYGNVSGCPRCGSHNLKPRGYSYTQVYKYQRLRCSSCGSWSRERISDRSEERPWLVPQ